MSTSVVGARPRSSARSSRSRSRPRSATSSAASRCSSTARSTSATGSSSRTASRARCATIRWRHTVVETRDWDTIIVPERDAARAATSSILGKRDGPAASQHRMWVYFNVDFRFAPTRRDRGRATRRCQTRADRGRRRRPEAARHLLRLREGRARQLRLLRRALLAHRSRARRSDELARARAHLHGAQARRHPARAAGADGLFVERRRARSARRSPARRARRVDARCDVGRALPRRSRTRRARLARRPPARTRRSRRARPSRKQGAVAHWLYVLVSGTAEVRVQRATASRARSSRRSRRRASSARWG